MTATKPHDSDIDFLVIQEVTKLVGQSDQPEVAIAGILRMISQMLGLNRGRVLLPDPETQNLQIRYAYGLTDEEKQRGTYCIGEGITGRVMKTSQVAVIQNIDEEPLYLARAVDRKTLPNDIVAYIALPILDNNRPIGVLAAHRIRTRTRPFAADLSVLRIIATLIAQIIRINTLINERTEKLKNENKQLKFALYQKQSDNNYGILGDSPTLKHALNQVMQVAATDVTVLLTGESGTGKERFSRMLHLASNRKDGPFIALNCAAIPETLLESELFGHEKGAFTGAMQTKKGKFELASQGSLFLDEIGDLSLELQSKLLRVLEKSSIQRVGGVKEIPIDVRIITATHKNLQQAVNEGRFRLDLFYRLNVFPVTLPPLRERRGDIRILARHFLNAANFEYHKNTILDYGVIERLESYNWPGNIRQLENIIKRAVLISQHDHITLYDIEMILRQESYIANHIEAGQMNENFVSETASVKPTAMLPAMPQLGSHRPYSWVKSTDADKLLRALEQAGGNKTRAALILGMTPRQFRYRLDKLGLNKIEDIL